MVAQIAPAVRVAIAETMGLAPGAITAKQIVTGLRQLGFDYVFGEGAPPRPATDRSRSEAGGVAHPALCILSQAASAPLCAGATSQPLWTVPAAGLSLRPHPDAPRAPL